MRILVLQYETALGTAVSATPLFEALKKAIPGASITAACSGLPAEVLRHSPYIDSLLETPHPFKNWLKAASWFFRDVWLKGISFDYLVVDSGNRRGRCSWLGLFSRSKTRLGFAFPRSLLHRQLAYDPSQSIIANNLRIVEAMGFGNQELEPSIFFSQTDHEKVSLLFRELGIAEDKPLVALQTQTSGGEPNRWFDDRFAQIAKHLFHAHGAQVIFLGTASETAAIEEIRRKSGVPSFLAAGRTDIATLSALLCRCDLLVTVDTGTMHVGRAGGVPMVIIAHAKSPEHEWLPLGFRKYRILRRTNIPCALCGKNFCATRECMDEISTGEVASAIDSHLAEFPPCESEREVRINSRLISRQERVELAA